MHFLNLLGFVAAIAIPALIVLYLLKQQFEEIPISSTYLWKQALTETQASKPWQKLRNNILLILQLLILAALILALARPFLLREGVGHETVIILDVSMSMQAEDQGDSRIESAKEKLSDMINSMLPQDRITLISAGKDAKMLISRSDDKGKLSKIVDEISAQNGGAAIDEAAIVAKALQREIDGMAIIVMTDYAYDDKGVTVLNFAGNGQNAAVESVSYAEDASTDSLTILARIRSFGKSGEITVECEIDGEIADVRAVTLMDNEAVNVYFKDLNKDASKATVRILEKDHLPSDNEAYCYIQAQDETKALLITDRNVFLEKALNLRPDLELNKASAEDAVNLSGYDLYVFDGKLIPELPTDAAIWIINPPNDVLGYVVTESEGGIASKGSATFADNMLTYINLEELQVAKAKKLTAGEQDDLSPIMMNGENALMLAGERNGQRILITGFDFHDSNWPVSKDFPIFVHSALQWMLPQALDSGDKLISGDVVTVTPRATTQKVTLITPDDQETVLAPPFPAKAFSDTNELGFYTLKQFDDENREIKSVFTVNAAVSTESDLRTMNASSDSEDSLAKISSNQEITYILILLALVIMMLEWWVYRRGH